MLGRHRAVPLTQIKQTQGRCYQPIATARARLRPGWV
jgi:hypothetical protein